MEASIDVPVSAVIRIIEWSITQPLFDISCSGKRHAIITIICNDIERGCIIGDKIITGTTYYPDLDGRIPISCQAKCIILRQSE